VSARYTSNHGKYITSNPLKRVLIKNFQRALFSMLPSERQIKLADLGCGEGFITNYLLHKNPHLQIYGYDINEGVLKLAQKSNPSVEFSTLDIRNIPIALKQVHFDYVLLLEVLEHIESFESVLEELQGMSFSYLIISVPNEPFFSWGNMLFGKNISHCGRDPEHVNFWNESSFQELVSNYFEILSFKRPFPWLVFLCTKKR